MTFQALAHRPLEVRWAMTLVLRIVVQAWASDRQTGMYGPPPFCKRRMRMAELVCANVFGLYWSSDLLA